MKNIEITIEMTLEDSDWRNENAVKVKRDLTLKVPEDQANDLRRAAQTIAAKTILNLFNEFMDQKGQPEEEEEEDPFAGQFEIATMKQPVDPGPVAALP